MRMMTAPWMLSLVGTNLLLRLDAFVHAFITVPRRPIAVRSSSSSSSSSSPHRSSVLWSTEEERSSNTESSSSSSSLLDKTFYQRTFYRLAGAPIVLEERLRFQVLDPETQPDIVSPVGPRTIVIRDAPAQEGKIGNVVCTMNVVSSSSSNTKNTHTGRQPSQWQGICATALYLSTVSTGTENVWYDKVLQLASVSTSSVGFYATLLGSIGAAYKANNQNKKTSTSSSSSTGDGDEVDILTVPKDKDSLFFPKTLRHLVLTDGTDTLDEDLIRNNLQAARISPSSGKVIVQPMEWSRRRQQPMQHRSAATPEFHTIVVSDLEYTYPEAKELACTIAHALEPSGPYFVTVKKQGLPLPRLIHICNDARSDSIAYFTKILHDGFRMSISDPDLIELECISFALQSLEGGALPPAAEEAALDPLVLEVQDSKVIDFRVIVAQHHADYTGGGTGEYFFPLENGQYDQRSTSTYLERQPGKNGLG